MRMHCRLLSLALTALLPLAAHAAAPPRAVTLVQTYDTQPVDEPFEYVPVWLGRGVVQEATMPRSLIGQPLQLFDAGASTGAVRLTALSVDDNSMCGGTARLRFKGATSPTTPVLLSSVDLNPGQRFATRAATPSEQTELLRLLGESAQLRQKVKPAALNKALAAFAADRANDAASLQIFTDARAPQRRVAVLTQSHPTQTGNTESPTGVLTVFALLEHTGQRWQLRQGNAENGCDDCEGLPRSTHLLQFGDIDGNGTLDFVLSDSGYETYGFYLLLGEGDRWQSETLMGGC